MTMMMKLTMMNTTTQFERIVGAGVSSLYDPGCPWMEGWSAVFDDGFAMYVAIVVA